MGAALGSLKEPVIIPAHLLPEVAAKVEAQRKKESVLRAEKQEAARKVEEKERVKKRSKEGLKQYKKVIKGISKALSNSTSDRCVHYDVDLKQSNGYGRAELLCVDLLRDELCKSGYLVDVTSALPHRVNCEYVVCVFPYDRQAPDYHDRRILLYEETAQDRERRKQVARGSDPRPKSVRPVEEDKEMLAGPAAEG